MGTSKRYAEHYDRVAAERIADSSSAACTLPQQAYGLQPIAWVPAHEPRPEVWAWITWPDRPAERLPAVATGWNDRVVIVEWMTVHGVRNVVVWRNAVTRRNGSS